MDLPVTLLILKLQTTALGERTIAKNRKTFCQDHMKLLQVAFDMCYCGYLTQSPQACTPAKCGRTSNRGGKQGKGQSSFGF